MSNIVDPLVLRIAARVRGERERRRWTLARLAEVSGVSQAMISRIERGESSPTAVVLGKLSAAFQLSIASLVTPTEGTSEDSTTGTAGVGRRADASEWRDPGTGYTRRQVSGPHFPAEIAEIRLPARTRVPYPAAAFAFVRQIVWVLDGHLTFHDGDTVHELDEGDTIELGAPTPRVFANTTDAECRYAVILSRGTRP
ncbi:helix-turn-helix domain-containing protein [Streptomyces sp. NPDC057287]|uniref:helix-turn-helix domain-containing protein n=1 Tax=Streptomyces sp. NPDC057287 TaxID=3346086 RepID=UPI003641202A